MKFINQKGNPDNRHNGLRWNLNEIANCDFSQEALRHCLSSHQSVECFRLIGALTQSTAKRNRFFRNAVVYHENLERSIFPLKTTFSSARQQNCGVSKTFPTRMWLRLCRSHITCQFTHSVKDNYILFSTAHGSMVPANNP